MSRYQLKREEIKCIRCMSIDWSNTPLTRIHLSVSNLILCAHCAIKSEWNQRRKSHRQHRCHPKIRSMWKQYDVFIHNINRIWLGIIVRFDWTNSNLVEILCVTKMSNVDCEKIAAFYRVEKMLECSTFVVTVRLLQHKSIDFIPLNRYKYW